MPSEMFRPVFIEDKNNTIYVPRNMPEDDISSMVLRIYDDIPHGPRGRIAETAVNIAGGIMEAGAVAPMAQAMLGNFVNEFGNRMEESDLPNWLDSAVKLTEGSPDKELSATLRRMQESRPADAGNIFQRVGKRIMSDGLQGVNFWQKQAGKFPMGQDVASMHIADDPIGTLFNAKWWAANTARMTPTMAATLMGAYAFGPMGLGTTLTGAAFGGAVGGVAEGAGTYRTSKERGMSDEEAVTNATKMAIISSVLNTASLDVALTPFAKSRIFAVLTSGSIESITEMLEEPAEGIIMGDSWPEMQDRLRNMWDVAPIAFGPGAVGATGVQLDYRARGLDASGKHLVTDVKKAEANIDSGKETIYERPPRPFARFFSHGDVVPSVFRDFLDPDLSVTASIIGETIDASNEEQTNVIRKRADRASKMSDKEQISTLMSLGYPLDAVNKAEAKTREDIISYNLKHGEIKKIINETTGAQEAERQVEVRPAPKVAYSKDVTTTAPSRLPSLGFDYTTYDVLTEYGFAPESAMEWARMDIDINTPEGMAKIEEMNQSGNLLEAIKMYEAALPEELAAPENAAAAEHNMKNGDTKLFIPKTEKDLLTQKLEQDYDEIIVAKRRDRNAGRAAEEDSIFGETDTPITVNKKRTVEQAGDKYKEGSNVISALNDMPKDSNINLTRPIPFVQMLKNRGATPAEVETVKYVIARAREESNEVKPDTFRDLISGMTNWATDEKGSVANPFYRDPNEPKRTSIQRRQDAIRVKLASKHNEFLDIIDSPAKLALWDRSRKIASKTWDSFRGTFSYKARYEILGGERTGEAIANRQSIIDYVNEYGRQVADKIGKVTEWGKIPQALAVFIADDPEFLTNVLPPNVLAQIDSDDISKAKAAANEWSNMNEASRQDLINAGGLLSGYRDTVKDMLQASMEDEGNIEKRAELESLVSYVDELNFVHVPTSLWFADLFVKNPSAGAKLLRALRKRKITNVKIWDLVNVGLLNAEDVSIVDVIISQSKRFGKILANAKVLKTAVDEGIAVPMYDDIHEYLPIPDGYVRPPASVPMFSDYYVHHQFAKDMDYLHRPIDYSTYSHKARGVLGAIKSFRFVKPGYLPMMDLTQAAMHGILPSLPQHFKGAVDDVMNLTETYKQAMFNGAISAVGGDIHYRFGKDLARATEEPIVRIGKFDNFKIQQSLDDLFRIKNLLPQHMIKEVYNIMHGSAWTFDHIIRLAAYRHFIEAGLTPREAGQEVAISFGDYSDVPRPLAHKASLALFTPSFKIGMTKLAGRMIQGAYRTALTSDATRADIRYAKGLAYSAGMLAAFHLAMTSALGFEQEKWGWKYKKTVNTDEGPKDLVVGWSMPANMFLKFAYRASDALRPGRIDTAASNFVRSMRWEIHPAYLIAYDVLAKNKDREGNPIYSHFDSPVVKAAKGLAYATLEAIPLLQAVVGTASPWQRTIDDPMSSSASRRKLAEEVGRPMQLILATYAFEYLQDPKIIRLSRELKALQEQANYEMYNWIENGDSEDSINKKLQNYAKQMQSIAEQIGDLEPTEGR